MGTLLLKGKPVSDSIRLALEPRVQSLKKIGIVPKLAAIIVGDDPASQVCMFAIKPGPLKNLIARVKPLV